MRHLPQETEKEMSEAQGKWYPRIRASYKVYDCHACPIGDVRDFEEQEFFSKEESEAMVREAVAKTWEDAAKLIRKFPRCTQDTMIGNYERLAKKARAQKESK